MQKWPRSFSFIPPLFSLLSVLCSPVLKLTMTSYELHSIIPSPGRATTFIEFSTDGRFLAAGDGSKSLYILDKLSGFHPMISAIMLAKPTSLVWETSKTFYVGLSNGWFIHYGVDLEGKKLVKGAVNNDFNGAFPIAAIALDMDSETLAFSVGPEVFAYRRIGKSSTFHSSRN